MGKARNSASKRQVKVEPCAGLDGAQEFQAEVRISLARASTQTMRARPGSFVWRYGRRTADGHLLEAGSHFARLWERAGTAAPVSPDYGKAGGSDWKGLPDGRTIAMDELRGAMTALGKMTTSRLSDYCVMGMTTADIARKHGSVERDMAAVLEHDLKACAVHFRYLNTRAA